MDVNVAFCKYYNDSNLRTTKLSIRGDGKKIYIMNVKYILCKFMDISVIMLINRPEVDFLVVIQMCQVTLCLYTRMCVPSNLKR